MAFKEKLIDFIKMNDFFNSRELLRVQKQNDYRTTTGGIISAGIIIIIITGFARMIIDTLNLSIITYTTKIDKQMIPGPINLTANSESNFMFGLQLGATNQVYERFNLSSSVRYFDFNLFYYDLQTGAIVNGEQIPLQMCTAQHWQKIKSSVQNFDRLNVTNWLCPKLGSSASLYGKYSNSKSSMLYISGSPCQNETDPNRLCASPEQIDNFFSRNGDQFFVTIYYINTLINPDQQEYLTYYLEDMTYLGFGKKMGNQVQLKFEEYVIKTDYSIWPFQSFVQEVGFIINDNVKQYPYEIKTSDIRYFLFTLWRSDKSYYYKREVQKISATLSFMGGLIGAVVAFLFIINSFTNYSYQISMAIQIFRKQEKAEYGQKNMDSPSEEEFEDRPIKEANILQYLKFSFYKLQKLVCSKIQNEAMEKIDQYRQQVLKQLDVRLLIRRVIFIQFCLKHIFEDYQLSQLQSNFPSSPEAVRILRQKNKQIKSCKTQMLIGKTMNNNQFNFTQFQLSQKDRQFESAKVVNIQNTNFEEKKRVQIGELEVRAKQFFQKGIKSFELQPRRNNIRLLFQEAKKGHKLSQAILATAISNLESKFSQQEDDKKHILNNPSIQFNESKNLPVIFFEIPVERDKDKETKSGNNKKT